MRSFTGEVIRVVHADTLEVRIDLGFGVYSDQRLTLRGIAAPPTSGPERAEGSEAAAAVIALLSVEDRIIDVEVYAVNTSRHLYETYVFIGDVQLNDWLVANGHAKYTD